MAILAKVLYIRHKIPTLATSAIPAIVPTSMFATSKNLLF